MSNSSSRLGELQCHFTWAELKQKSDSRTLEMNLEDLEEHIRETIEGTEVESYNLLGYYKTEMGRLDEAKDAFQKALSRCKTEDEKVVSRGCLAWLESKEMGENISGVRELLPDQTGMRDIPEVMANKAFAIANSGYTNSGFIKARDCINKALEKRPDNVQYKYTKAVIMKKLHRVEGHEEVTEICKLFEDVIDSSLPMYPKLHGLALVQYALFLGKIYRDYGKTGNRFAEKAKEVAGSNRVILRGVAEFYIIIAGNDMHKLQKGIEIIKEILEDKPNGYTELTLLGQGLTKLYRVNKSQNDFDKAKECLLKSWSRNKEYIMPALDLLRLYRFRYRYDFAYDITSLEKSSEKLLNEILSYETSVGKAFKANIYSEYGLFLNKYGEQLAINHRRKSREYQVGETLVVAEENECHNKIQEAVGLTKEYQENPENSLLVQAQNNFRDVFLDLEQQDRHVQALFHKEYADFLEKHAMELALYRYVESFKCNSNPRNDEHVYEPIVNIAESFISSDNVMKQLKGREALSLIEELLEKR